MKQIILAVKARSPIAVRADQAEDGSTSALYIPGTTLAGSLAAAYRLLHSERSDAFAELFLKERISFPFLYPALFKKSALGIDSSNLPVVPLPKTAQTCKRFPGFRPVLKEDTNEERHGIRDSLLDWAAFSLLEQSNASIPDLLDSLEQHKDCHCKQPMDHISGYYRRDRFKPQVMMKADVHTRLQTRTGIDRTWGVVEEGVLYNRQVFDENMRFWGKVILPDELSESFCAFLEEADKEEVIRIGTGRTRGLGFIGMKPVEAKRPGLESFKARLEKFDAALKDRLVRAHVEKHDAFYFAIALYSPTILSDEFLRYRKTLDAATLMRLLFPDEVISKDQQKSASGEQGGWLKSVYRSVSVERIAGWSELWGTPRAIDYALTTGSTFLFASSRSLDDRLLQALYRLEETGIGRRTAGGFGRICVSDPFHLEVDQI